MDATTLFGNGFFQNNEIIVIQKSDIPKLTRTSTNTAESLLVGIILMGAYAFNGVIIDSDGDNLCDRERNIVGYTDNELREISFEFWRNYLDNKYQYSQFVLNIFTPTPA